MVFENLSEHSVNVMSHARQEAQHMESIAVDLEHVLLGLLNESNGVAYHALKKNRLLWNDVRAHLWLHVRDKRELPADEIAFGENIDKLIALATVLVKEKESENIETEHLLLALLEIKNWRARDVFDTFGVDLRQLRSDIYGLASKKGRNRYNSAYGARPVNREFPPGKIIGLAQDEASRLGHNLVGTEQFLLALCAAGGKLSAVLEKFGLDLLSTRQEVDKIIGRGSGFVAVEISFTPRAKRVLELSWNEARQRGDNFIAPEHLLLALISEGAGVATRVFQLKRVDTKALSRAVIDLLNDPGDADALV